ncbi:hypothetical protein F511_05326 [Dorcoceras hygrometricum]|uniref:Uncharacterized protein n=1 Tax=Dorcoceras hygrometricum TaxID=472368 RepID=A0A2Z7ALJ0_9LAMI|nr:hypothetical protein F511_05326 [Dorcoceras hygrometricum]
MRDRRASPVRPAARNHALDTGQHAGVARAHARGDDEEAPPSAAAPWRMQQSQGDWLFTVGGGRLRQSGPRLEGRLLRQPALEGLTRSARMDSPRKVGRNKFR